MSRINTENLLRLTPVQPDVAPVIPQPDYASSQFIGGGVELGQAAQNIGQGSETAMYASLAEIAKGTQQGLNNWADIGSRIEKEKITQVENEFDRIDISEDLPEVKYERFDELLRNTSTPLLGTSWREKFAIQAERSWLSEEGKNKFEEQRYNKELVQFLNRPENKNRQSTPELLEIFNNEYQERHPSAEYNGWFKVKSFENSSKIIQNQIQDAVSSVGPSLETLYMVPSSEQIKAIMNGDTETTTQFEGFLQLKTNMPTGLVDFEKAFLLKTEKELFELMGSDTPPEVFAEVKKQIGLVGKAKAREIWKASSEMRYLENQQQLSISLAAAETNLKRSPNFLNASSFYMDTVSRTLGKLNVPLVTKREAVYDIVGTMVEAINNAVTTNRDSEFRDRYPNWVKMAPHERVDVAIKVLEDWSTRNPEGIKNLVEALQFTDEEAKAAGYSSAKSFAEAMIVENGRTKALSSESTLAAQQQNAETSASNTTTIIATMSNWVNPDQITKTGDDTLKRLAEELGISVRSLQLAYRDEEGLFSLNTDLDSWFRGLPTDERETLKKRGFTLNNSALLYEYRRQGYNVEMAVNNYLVKLREGNKASTSSTHEASVLASGASKFRTTDNGPGQDFKTAWVSGSFAESENSAFKTSLYMYLADLNKVRSAIQEGRNRQTFTTEETAAFERAQTLEQDFPRIVEFARMVDEVNTSLGANAPRYLESIPTPNVTTPGQAKLNDQEVQEMVDRISRGSFKISANRPATIVDSDGTWSKESLYTFVATQFMVERALLPTATDKERDWFGREFDHVLERLALATDLSTNEAKYDLTVFALLGRAYKEASSRQQGPVYFHGRHALTVRAMIAGNAMEESDLPTMLERFKDPINGRKLDATLSIIKGLAMANNNARSSVVGVATIQTSYGGQEFRVRDMSIMRVASAFAAQPTGEEMQSGTWYTGNVKPTSAEWNPNTLVDVLNKNGVEVGSKTELANQFRRRILSSYPRDVVVDLSDDQAIQYGAIVLQSVFETNPNLLYDTLEIALGPTGINNPDVNDEGKANKLNLFFEILETTLDLDSSHTTINSSDPRRIGVSPINSIIAMRGTVIDESNNAFMIPQPTYTIYGSSNSNSWTNTTYNKIADEGIHISSVDTTKDFRLVKDRLEKIFKPATLFGSGRQQGTANGTNWILGSMVLDMPPVITEESRFSLVKNWAAAHGLGSIEEILGPDNEEITTTPSQMFNRGQKQMVKGLLRKALKDNSSKSTLDWLESLDREYRGKGGSIPFINRDSYNRSGKGFSELVQYSPGTTRTSALPTWSWVNRTTGGIPMITVSDAYFYDPYSTEQELLPDFVNYVNTHNNKAPPKPMLPYQAGGSPI